MDQSMATTAQQPQLRNLADVVGMSHQKPEAFQQEMVGIFGGSDQERELDIRPSPVKPSRLHIPGDAAITDDPETPASGSNGRGKHDDHGAPPISTLQTTDHEGEISSDGGTHPPFPHNPDVKLDCLFNRLKIEAEGDAAKAEEGKQKKDEDLETLHTRIQGLEHDVELEASRRLEAESRAESLETELEVLADRWDLEIAAREAAESNAKRYMGLFTEARAAWQNTQGIVENKERELAAAEEKMKREAGDVRSMQCRLEDARKGKELDRQHTLALKLALEGPLAGGGTFSSISAASAAVAVVPSPEAEDKSIPEKYDAGGSSGNNKNVPATSRRNAEGREGGDFESLSSPQANLEDGRVAAAEARLEAAIAVAATAARSKRITATSLMRQKAQLKHVQQQAPSHGNYPGLPPRRQLAPTSKDTPLSPIALSYFPSAITAAALQQHDRQQQQQAQRQPDGDQEMICHELEEPALDARKGDDAQPSFSAPSPPGTPGTPGTGVAFFPPPLPRRQPDFGEGNGRSGGGDVGFASDDTGSPSAAVTTPMQHLLQGFSGPPEKGDERERAEQPRGQQQEKRLLIDVPDGIFVSDETYHGFEALTTATNHSNKNNGFGSETAAILGEDCAYGGIYGSDSDGGNGSRLENDENPEQACAVTTPLNDGGGGCLGAVEEEKYAERNVYRDTVDGREKDIVKRAGALLEALESARCMEAMVTLEVGMGSALQFMNEGKFLKLHDTEEGIGELLSALGSTGIAF